MPVRLMSSRLKNQKTYQPPLPSYLHQFNDLCLNTAQALTTISRHVNSPLTPKYCVYYPGKCPIVQKANCCWRGWQLRPTLVGSLRGTGVKTWTDARAVHRFSISTYSGTAARLYNLRKSSCRPVGSSKTCAIVSKSARISEESLRPRASPVNVNSLAS